jgi:peptidyl-prolyl cis-trans isomerase B (cyclophilin B)
MSSAPAFEIDPDATFDVTITTDKGDIVMALDATLAPNTVNNFVVQARAGFYDGLTFHRVVPGFVIQGGDPNSKDDDPRNDGMGGPRLRDVLTEAELKALDGVNDMLAAKGYAGLDGAANLKAEFSQTAKHVKGSLSMARSQDIDSAGSQFFICVEATPDLDGQYTLFGHVFLGQDVADAIVAGDKNTAAGRDAPAVPVTMKHVTIIEGTDGLNAEEKAAWDALPASLKNVK